MKFLSRQTQNRWKFVVANVRGRGFANCNVIFEGGLNTWGEGVDFCPK